MVYRKQPPYICDLVYARQTDDLDLKTYIMYVLYCMEK